MLQAMQGYLGDKLQLPGSIVTADTTHIKEIRTNFFIMTYLIFKFSIWSIADMGTLYPVMLLAVGVFIIVYMRGQKSRSDVKARRLSKANKVARRRLSRAGRSPI